MVLMTDTDFIVNELHSNMIQFQEIIWIMPFNNEGSDGRLVTVAFSESRYLKDGTQENVRLIDRIFHRDGKIFRIHQWDAEME